MIPAIIDLAFRILILPGFYRARKKYFTDCWAQAITNPWSGWGKKTRELGVLEAMKINSDQTSKTSTLSKSTTLVNANIDKQPKKERLYFFVSLYQYRCPPTRTGTKVGEEKREERRKVTMTSRHMFAVKTFFPISCPTRIF